MSICCIGELTVDWVSSRVGDTFQQAESFYRCAGGNALNVALGAARLEVAVSLIGKVGADLHGNYLISQVKEAGIDMTGLVRDESLPTAQCYCWTDAAGEPAYYNWPRPHAAAALTLQPEHRAIIENAAICHATGVSLVDEPRRSAVLAALRHARDKQVLVSFDAGFPYGEAEDARPAVEEAMRLADIVKVNKEELYCWTQANRNEPAEELGGYLRERLNARILVVTLGAQGAFILTDKQAFSVAAYAVQSICPIGSGDAFMAGLLAAVLKQQQETSLLLEMLDWTYIGRFAALCGAFVTGKPGANAGFPTPAVLQEALNQAGTAPNPLKRAGDLPV